MCAARRTDPPLAQPPARRGARVRLDLDERRAQLVALGLAAFSERAYDEVSVDDVARSAGVSKGLLYHYFPTKRDFYVACLREAAKRLLAETIGACDDDAAPPLDRVRQGIDAYLDYVVRHARAFTALFRGGIGSDPQVAAVIEETRSAYVDRLLDGAELYPLAQARSGSPGLRIALRGWVALAEAVSLEWVERRELPQAALRELLVEMLLAALRAGAALAPST